MNGKKYMTFKGVPKTNISTHKLGKPKSVVTKNVSHTSLSKLGKKY